MEQTAILIDRFKELPESMRYQVLDFIDFLIVKNQTKNNELTGEQKLILDTRYAISQEKPESRIAWSELKQELFEHFKPSQTT